MTRKDFEWIADTVGPLFSAKYKLEQIADDLESTNPRFDRERFLKRAYKAWEQNNAVPIIDDEIPY